MASITQDMKYHLSLIQYSKKHGVTKAAIKYYCNRRIFPSHMNRDWKSLSRLS